MDTKICNECKRELPIEQFELEHTKKYVALPGTSEHQTGLAIDLGAYINKQYTGDINENTITEME